MCGILINTKGNCHQKQGGVFASPSSPPRHFRFSTKKFNTFSDKSTMALTLLPLLPLLPLLLQGHSPSPSFRWLWLVYFLPFFFPPFFFFAFLPTMDSFGSPSHSPFASVALGVSTNLQFVFP